MNFDLTDEQNLIKKTAREFAVKELLPQAIERDHKKIWPKEAVDKMANLGFMGMMVNNNWDGGGMDTISYAIAMEEIARVDASAAVIMSVNNSLVCYLLEKFGSEFIKEKYFYRVRIGPIFDMSFAEKIKDKLFLKGYNNSKIITEALSE